jgi:UDP-N-acetylmuramate--alanine ligase
MADKVYAHFIGVGGAGMSGIAHVLHARGVKVSGSDLKLSRYAQQLADEGVPVAIGHDAANLGDPEIVVVSSAIPETNPELAEARRRSIPVWQRAKMLAHLAGEQKTLAVAGTHGKTSTSSMVAQMLAAMGEDPTFLIGGELNDMGANARSEERRSGGGIFVLQRREVRQQQGWGSGHHVPIGDWPVGHEWHAVLEICDVSVQRPIEGDGDD